MSRSYNQHSPGAFCNRFWKALGPEMNEKVEVTRWYGTRMEPAYRFATDDEKWAALIKNNPTVPRRVLQMWWEKYRYINGNAERQFAKKHEPWQPRARTHQRVLIAHERYDDIAPRAERLLPGWGW